MHWKQHRCIELAAGIEDALQRVRVFRVAGTVNGEHVVAAWLQSEAGQQPAPLVRERAKLPDRIEHDVADLEHALCDALRGEIAHRLRVGHNNNSLQ